MTAIVYKFFSELKKKLILVSMSNFKKFFTPICPMLLVQENCNFSSSLATFSVNNNSTYYSQIGGRALTTQKLNFLFEIFCPIFLPEISNVIWEKHFLEKGFFFVLTKL